MYAIGEIETVLEESPMVEEVTVDTDAKTHISFRCFLGQDVMVHPSTFKSFKETYRSMGGSKKYHLNGSTEGVTLSVSVMWSNVLDDYSEYN